LISHHTRVVARNSTDQEGDETMSQALQVGVGRATITPPVGIYQIGFGRKSGSRSIHDDLYATVLVMGNGQNRAALVNCDLLFLHPEVISRVRADVGRRTPIPPSNVMFCCTHTHSGPIVYALPDSDERDRGYVENLVYQLSGAVCMANDDMREAHMGVGHGCVQIGINRRARRPDGTMAIGENPEGPVDTEVGVIRFDTPDGTPIAVVVNYACHPVILGPKSLAISADYPGQTRKVVEQITGAKMLFLQGASGNINPLGGVRDNYRNARWLGTMLAGEVLRTYETVTLTPLTALKTISRSLQVPLEPLPEEVRPPAPQTARTAAHRPWPWRVEVQDDEGQLSTPVEMQALGLNDTVIVGAPGEVFVEIGLEVKGQSSVPDTFFAGYTNGCIGYIPVPEAYPEGGYEVSRSYLGYQLPEPVSPRTAELMVTMGLDLIDKLQ
jgi:neutral ceramidase